MKQKQVLEPKVKQVGNDWYCQSASYLPCMIIGIDLEGGKRMLNLGSQGVPVEQQQMIGL